MEGGNGLCSECGRASVECFCTCSGGEALLCSSCFLKHAARAPRKEHPMRLIETLPFFKIPGYYERLEARTTAWPLVHEQALRNLQEVDRAIEEITVTTETAIATLRRRCADSVEQLRQTKGKIQAAVDEVEKTLSDDSPALKAEFSVPIRTALAHSGGELKLFSYRIESNSGTVTLHFPIADPPIGYFPCVWSNTVKLIDLKTKQNVSFTVSTNFGYGGSFCFLDTNSLLCAGASPFSAATYNLYIPSRVLTLLQPMRTARNCLGLVKSDSRLCSTGPTVFAFGGYNQSTQLTSCEKFTISTKAWTPLKDMANPRGVFSPCEYKDQIYLADTYPSHRVIEIFDIATENFAVFPVSLPTTLANYSAAFILDGELTILTYDQIGKLALKTETQFRVSQSNKQQCRSSCPPLVYGKVVYLAYRDSGELLTYSLESNSFIV